MYKSQFQKIDPYDWFCGQGHKCILNIWLFTRVVLFEMILSHVEVL